MGGGETPRSPTGEKEKEKGQGEEGDLLLLSSLSSVMVVVLFYSPCQYSRLELIEDDAGRIICS